MPAIVCRDDALRAVTGALEQPPTLVLVEGEAGIGKTRLVQECLWSGGWPERTVLTVNCQPVAKPTGLGPVVDGLRRLREEIGGVELSPLGGALRPLFPEWGDDLPPAPEPLEESGATQHRVYRALAELVDRLRVDLVVVEDAHWADSACLEWLMIAGESWGDRRSVVVTFRPRDVPSVPPQLRRLASRMPPGMSKVRVVLDPLDVSGIQQLTAEMFHTDVSREFAEFLHQRTGGLPLAVEECLKLLRDRGEIVRRDGEWARVKELAQMQVPPNLRDAVLARVERLDARTRMVLDAAAVLGEPADDRLLAAVAQLDMRAVRAAVAVGFRAGLLRGAGLGQVAFRHQLAAEAVEAEIPPYERRRLHQRAGEALEAAGEPSVPRLSRHFKEAGDVEAWTRYAEASVDQALRAGDDRTAVSVLHELLTTTKQPPGRRATLARDLGEVAAAGATLLDDRTGQLAKTLRSVADDPEISAGERGEIRLLLGRMLLWWPGQRQAAYEEIELAVPDLDDRPALACHAMMLLGTPLVPDWQVKRHLHWVERAATQLPRVESKATRVSLVADRARALLALGEEAGWSASDEISRAASDLAEQRAVADGMLKVGSLAIDWGYYGDARSRLNQAVAVIEATGYRRLLNLAQVVGAYLDWCTGRWEGLAEAAARLAGAKETEPVTIRLHARQLQGLVEMTGGERERAEQRLRAVLDGYAQCELVGPEAATAAAALGRLRLSAGAVEEALQITELAMTMISRKGVWLWATDLAPVRLDVLVAAGERRMAEELAERFAGWRASRDAPAPAAASRQCQAIVTEAYGEKVEAAELFAEAAGAWAALPHPYHELLARERQGQCLLAAAEKDKGLAVLSDTRRRLHGLGARWDADRVAQLLRRHGVDVPRPWRSGPRGYGDHLSPREREVLALVAQGMSNPEAGRVLFLSPRTIARHLSTAMRKLGASTRTTAALAAAEAGLIPATPEEPAGEPAR